MTYIDPLAERIKFLASESAALPDDTRLLFQIYALLARAKGMQVTARDVHDAWVVWMDSKGEQHPSMVPFDELNSEVQKEDQPFVDAIHRSVKKGGVES